MSKGQICIRFNEVPPGTNYIKNTHSWVNKSEGEKYVKQGFGVLYDPTEKKEIKPKTEKPSTDLPYDFPGRSHFIDAKIFFIKDIKLMKDYDQIPGVGQSIESKVIEYLKKHKL